MCAQIYSEMNGKKRRNITLKKWEKKEEIKRGNEEEIKRRKGQSSIANLRRERGEREIERGHLHLLVCLLQPGS